MRRLRRWALHFAASVSAVLFVAVCVLWVRSYRVMDVLSRQSPWSATVLTSHAGSLQWQRVDQRSPNPFTVVEVGPTHGWQHEQWPAGSATSPSAGLEPGLQADWHALGFAWRRNLGTPPPPPGQVMLSSTLVIGRLPYRRLTVPYWFAAAAFAVVPLGLVLARVRPARRRLGLCPACGYDLRATPSEGGALLDRCPECGQRRQG